MPEIIYEIEDLFASVADYLTHPEVVEIAKKYGENVYKIYFIYDSPEQSENDFETEYSHMIHAMHSREWRTELAFDEVVNKHVLFVSI